MKCIFHIPWKLDLTRASASSIRPRKMKDAFEAIGYEVAVVSGDSKERKVKSATIAQRLAAGDRFEFVYSESSTMPTQLTDANHLPCSRDIDFGFFATCRQYGLKIGLFYRDIYWRFPEYKKIGLLKSAIATHYYKADLCEYQRTIDRLFVPSIEFANLLKDDIGNLKCMALPPGCDPQTAKACSAFRVGVDESRRLRLIYVGGIGQHYRMDTLFAALESANNVEVDLCVREGELEASGYSGVVGRLGNVRVLHVSGAELGKLYSDADAALMFFEAEKYQSIAIPFKTFEYIANGMPIIANENTAAASFIASNDIGWVLPHSKVALSALFTELANDSSIVARKAANCIRVATENTWETRARLVAQELRR